MGDEQNWEAWANYLEIDPVIGPRLVQKEPMCGNCKHWRILDDDGINSLEDSQIDHVATGMKGEVWI